MSSWSSPQTSTSYYTQSGGQPTSAFPGQSDTSYSRQRQCLQRSAQGHPRSVPSTTSSIPPPGLMVTERASSSHSPLAPPQHLAGQRWTDQGATSYQDLPKGSPWPDSPFLGHFSSQAPISPAAIPVSRPIYSSWSDSWQDEVHRRSSPEDNRGGRLGGYYSSEPSKSSSSSILASKTYPQRRPSNRDEFEGPSQFLEKPVDIGIELKEEDLPKLPVTLYAQEQDEILSKVNDRLSQTAFDFVAKYQFPIPLEPDKRPVRVPSDREWSEWVYLLKRLATKRRVPARVLYNGQIKQLITVLENSLEMRHAAKPPSRPLKDDRNILQLISSGLQVAKLVKDAPAMRYLDGLYMQTERLIQGRRGMAISSFGTFCLL